MRRRDFIRMVGSAAATWPFAARAQQREPLRRVAILEPIPKDTPSAQARYTAFLAAVDQLGWTAGRHVQIVRPWPVGQLAAIQAVAPSVGLEVSPIGLREPDHIERAIATFAQSPNGGIILAASGIGASNANLIITAGARYKLPAVYITRPLVVAGGL